MEEQELKDLAKKVYEQIKLHSQIERDCKDYAKQLVKSLGGEKVWDYDNGDDCPCFTSYCCDKNDVTDVFIERVWIGENDWLMADVYAYEIGDNFELILDDDNIDAFIEICDYLVTEIED